MVDVGIFLAFKVVKFIEHYSYSSSPADLTYEL